MHLDVLDLRTFYYRTRLGRAAQKVIRDQIAGIWTEAKGQTVLGYGFAAPVLRPYLADARRVIALMPAPQGVMPWPSGLPNVSVLCEETALPLPTGIADKLVLLHGLETCENPTALLEECDRVLGPGGRALFIVPNRAGLWARSDQTPFGYGRPYSVTQLETQLKRHGFAPDKHMVALFQPPSHRQFWLRSGPLYERLGQRLSNRYAGGVLLMEATKQVFARRGSAERSEAKRPVAILEGLPQPGRGAAVSRR